jgi:hypothetical protein
MSIPSGVQKFVAVAKETTWGTLASVGSGKKVRRKEAAFDLIKGTFESAEIRTDEQVVDYRHGMRQAQGNLKGEVSCLSYQDFLSALFRGPWATGVTTGAIVTVSAGNANGVYTRSAGSFITDGFKVGDMVVITGYTNPTNNTQAVIGALTATIMTTSNLSSVTEAAGPSVTIAVQGRKLQMPSSGHVFDSFTIESYYEQGTTDTSERVTGARVASMKVNVIPQGMSDIEFTFIGKDVASVSSASPAYFTSPTTEATTPVMSGANGALYNNGTIVAIVTGFMLEVDAGLQIGEVIGSTTPPDVFTGRFRVKGTLTAYFLDNTLWTSFSNETELSLVLKLTAGVTSAAGGGSQTILYNLPRVKLGSAGKDDKEVGGTIQTCSFQGLKYVGAGNYDGTTLVIQDTEVTTA